MNNRLCVPEGSWVSDSCRYWYEHQIDDNTRISIQKCDFDRFFIARVNIRYKEAFDGFEWYWVWLHQDTSGKTAVEALKNAHKLLEEMRASE